MVITINYQMIQCVMVARPGPKLRVKVDKNAIIVESEIVEDELIVRLTLKIPITGEANISHV
jgi:hypothetical protein